MNPTFQMIICANELPNTTEDNEATRRRYRNVPFESTFKSEDRIEAERKEQHLLIETGKLNKEDVNPHIYIVDPTLKKRIHELSCEFMNVLLDYYKNYKKTGF